MAKVRIESYERDEISEIITNVTSILIEGGHFLHSMFCVSVGKMFEKTKRK